MILKKQFGKFELLLFLIVLLGALIRAFYMLAPLSSSVTITPDEAVYGLQALHILKGEPSVFYWAQPYTGTFSACLSAILFFIFGVSRVALKIVPYLFSVGFIFLNIKLAKVVFKDKKVALVAGFISALGTPFWNNWSLRAGSGFPEACFLGNLVLLLTISIIWEDDPSGSATSTSGPPEPARRSLDESGRSLLQIPSAVQFFLLGFLGGLGFWIQPTIIYYLLPIACFLILLKPKIFLKKEPYLAVFGFFLGALPVVFYNLTSKFATGEGLVHKPWGVKASFFNLFKVSFPILLGTRTAWSTQDFFTPLAAVIGLLYLAAFIFILLKKRKTSFKSLEPSDLLLATFFSTLIIFIFASPFNQLHLEPRYILAFYSTLPLILAYFIVSCGWDINRHPERQRRISLGLRFFGLWPQNDKNAGSARKVLAGLALTLLTISFLLGICKAGPLSFVDPYNLSGVIDYLNENKISYLNSSGALAHRLMFLTEEKIVASVREGGLMEARYPPYSKWVHNAPWEKKGYLYLAKNEGFIKIMEGEIKNFAPDYKKVILDDTFVIMHPKEGQEK